MAGTFALLELPLELRRIIYADYITLMSQGSTRTLTRIFTCSGPPLGGLRLTQTCRQIRAEFLAEFCRACQLGVCCSSYNGCCRKTDRWIRAVGVSMIPLFRKMYFWNDIREPGMGIELHGSDVVVGSERTYSSLRKARADALREETGKVAGWGMRMGANGRWYLTDEVIRELMHLVKNAGSSADHVCMSD